MKKISSTTQRHSDGSVSLTWPRGAIDNQRVIRVKFLPIAEGPLIEVPAFRDRSLDESGPFGSTTWGYRISPGDVRRATDKATELMHAEVVGNSE